MAMATIQRSKDSGKLAEFANIRASLTVRAATGELKIIAVCQAIGEHAAQAGRARIHQDSKHNFEEITVMFESISSADLTEIAGRLNALPWVTVATPRPGAIEDPSIDAPRR
ncbi:hypothetical protein AB4Y45_40735 [Paraburkholderia sp. EG287A]|uniref:hypothetical protein n=1 Tax=unclassified Paraburkholderia TaxID=2615204 RepID=UPI0034D27167